MNRLLKQLQVNLLAIIGLVVAVSALNVSTMRADVSERQRNVRDASFLILEQLSYLQLLVDNSHYGLSVDGDQGATLRVNPIEGWARVNYVRDLAVVVPEPAPHSLELLHRVWSEEINRLAGGDRDLSLKANQHISAQIEHARNQVKSVLVSLK
ncbi:MAG: hypothetical protein ACRBBW_15585 [Cellvibrionaceae bacterium]